jgi:hypothetical protein
VGDNFLFSYNISRQIMGCCSFESLGYLFDLFKRFNMFVLPLGGRYYTQILFFPAEGVRGRVVMNAVQLVPFALNAQRLLFIHSNIIILNKHYLTQQSYAKLIEDRIKIIPPFDTYIYLFVL